VCTWHVLFVMLDVWIMYMVRIAEFLVVSWNVQWLQCPLCAILVQVSFYPADDLQASIVTCFTLFFSTDFCFVNDFVAYLNSNIWNIVAWIEQMTLYVWPHTIQYSLLLIPVNKSALLTLHVPMFSSLHALTYSHTGPFVHLLMWEQHSIN